MACFGLKLRQDLDNRAATPTENFEEYTPGDKALNTEIIVLSSWFVGSYSIFQF